jgi:hypothetical protein
VAITVVFIVAIKGLILVWKKRVGEEKKFGSDCGEKTESRREPDCNECVKVIKSPKRKTNDENAHDNEGCEED